MINDRLFFQFSETNVLFARNSLIGLFILFCSVLPAKEDPLVQAAIQGIPEEAAKRGVFPEDVLRARFLKVIDFCYYCVKISSPTNMLKIQLSVEAPKNVSYALFNPCKLFTTCFSWVENYIITLKNTRHCINSENIFGRRVLQFCNIFCNIACYAARWLLPLTVLLPYHDLTRISTVNTFVDQMFIGPNFLNCSFLWKLPLIIAFNDLKYRQ